MFWKRILWRSIVENIEENIVEKYGRTKFWKSIREGRFSRYISGIHLE
ncbi:MAG: hypothetical protein QW738_06830 [Nitrososphaeria archaeon]